MLDIVPACELHPDDEAEVRALGERFETIRGQVDRDEITVAEGIERINPVCYRLGLIYLGYLDGDQADKALAELREIRESLAVGS